MNPKSKSASDNAEFRYQALAEMLQKDIEAGKYAVGAKLPSERSLAKQINASHLTVRQGIDILVRMGLVRRELGSGTYVNSTKSDPIIAIIFGPSLVEESAHYYRALRATLESEIAKTPYTFRSYDGFNRTDAGAPEHSLPYQQLLRDTRNHPVKGFIQISLTDSRWNDLKPMKGVPRATHGSVDRDVLYDHSLFGRDSMELCVKNKRRYIAYLRNLIDPQEDLGGLGDAAKKYNVAMPEIIPLEEDGQPLDLLAHDKIEQMAEIWRKKRRWPDALIVSDDIATRGVAIALIKAGIHVPSDMLVITLANEGIDHHYGIDVHRHALPSAEVARKLLLVLENRMKGKKVDVPQLVRGRWTQSDIRNRRVNNTHLV